MPSLGIYQGSVLNNNDPERRGRVVCWIPQVLGDSQSGWCEPIYPTVYTPKVNEIVWVQFVNGDLTMPVYYSSEAITAEKIVAGSITAEELDIDSIFAKSVTVSGSLTAGIPGVTRTSKIDQNGLFLYDVEETQPPTKAPVVALPTNPNDPVQFQGTLTVRGLSVQTEGTIESDAGLEMTAGTAAPNVAPIVTLDHALGTPLTGWTLPTGTATTTSIVASCFTDTEWYVVLQRGTRSRVHRFPIDGGSATASYDPAGTAFSIYGIDKDADGNIWFLMSRTSDNKWMLRKYSPTISYLGPEIHTPWVGNTYLFKGLSIVGDQAYLGMLQNTSPNYAIRLGQVDLNEVIGTSIRNGPNTDSTAPGSYGFQAGDFDFGVTGPRFVFNHNGTARVFYSTGPGLAEDSTINWPLGTDGLITSKDPFVWCAADNGFRQHQRVSGAITGSSVPPMQWKQFTGTTWSTEPSTWWAGFTLRDSDPEGGLHETSLSKVVSFTMLKRHRLSLKIPIGIPDHGGTNDADSVSFYLARSTTDPTWAGMHLQEALDPGVSQIWLDSLPTFLGSTPPNPNSNPSEFPETLPGYIKSAGERLDGNPAFYTDGLAIAGAAITGERDEPIARFDALIPPGSLMMWAGATAPTGWFLCDGSEKDATLYPDLAHMLDVGGGNYRFGNGTAGKFLLPDLRGKMALGVSGAHALGTSGGAETATLGVGNLPPHVHGMRHGHNLRRSNATGSSNTNIPRGTTSTDSQGTGGIDDFTGDTADGSGAGLSGNPFNVMNPFLAINFIIKY